IQDHAAGQRFRRTGALRAAREKFVSCARDTCPTVLQRECSEWFAEVEAAQPTVVIHARAADGHEVVGARVFIDSEPVRGRLTGLALPIDPGEHTVRIVGEDGASAEERVLVREGEKRRAISIVFPLAPAAPPPPPPPAPKETGLPAAVYVLGGVALAGFAGF